MSNPGSKNRSSAIADDSVIDLRHIFRIWIRWSWVLIPVAALGAYIGYRDLQSYRPTYTASMIVQPSGGGQADQLSAVASRLGISLGGGGSSSELDRLSVLLGSVALAERLQEKYQLMQRVFAGSWDPAKEEWVRPSGEEFERSERIREFFRLNRWSPPTLESLAAYIKGNIEFDRISKAPFVEIVHSDSSPEIALEILEMVYFEADELLREQDRTEIEKRREYLDTQLLRATTVDSRQALRNLLTGEIRRASLLGSGLPYAARIIEPPHASTRPSEPNPRLVIGFPTAMTLFAALVLITLVAVIRRE